jgi:Icc-related predicted phosphoesterase
VIPCLFVSDLHGDVGRAGRLLDVVARERPRAVFLGGDLLPGVGGEGFVDGVVVAGFERLRRDLGSAYPAVFVILGNDDPHAVEGLVLEADRRGIWRYVHGRSAPLEGFTVYGYNCVPPTPFRLKDWERYDVSRYVDPGCVAPEDGSHAPAVSAHELRHATMYQDLARLTAGGALGRAVCLFHSPPYRTALDRAALDDRRVDHVALDVHVGSIAIRRLFEARRPWLGLHGHVHESARLTGLWQDRIGPTVLLGAAHDGPELALVRFDLERPGAAARDLVPSNSFISTSDSL